VLQALLPSIGIHVYVTDQFGVFICILNQPGLNIGSEPPVLAEVVRGFTQFLLLNSE
jgi:hypothetical protein